MVRLLFVFFAFAMPVQVISQVTYTDYKILQDTLHLTDPKYLSFLKLKELQEEGWLTTYALQAPIFDGNITDFVEHNTVNPFIISDDNIHEESVWIYFEIDTLGYTFNHQVMRTTNCRSEYCDEALRVCRLIKFDKPAYNNKKAIYCNYVVLVKFGKKNIQY